MNSNTVYESQFYDLDMRMIHKNDLGIKIFSNKVSFSIENQISFDLNYEGLSSLEHFLGSVGSSLLLTLFEQGKKIKLEIEDLEGKFKLQLENPLAVLGVKGYEGVPKIKKITGVIYLYADEEKNKLLNFCQNSIEKSPIFQTLKSSLEIDIEFKILI